MEKFWVVVWTAVCALFVSQSAESRKYTAVVMDADSGTVICSSRQTLPVHPASLTKMMTLYLLFEALDMGYVSLETPFRVSKRASNQVPCKIGFSAGQKLPVKQCILSVAVKSANDGAVVIAENLAGSVENFVHLMNARARQLGLMQTKFQNPSGLPHPNQWTSAQDIGVLIRAIWKRFPHYAHFMGTRSFAMRGHTYHSTNKLLGVVPGMCMGKTGYTEASGCNLATLTTRGDKSVIVVVMGGENSRWRNQKTARLIEASFAHPEQLVAVIAPPYERLALKSREASKKVVALKIKSRKAKIVLARKKKPVRLIRTKKKKMRMHAKYRISVKTNA